MTSGLFGNANRRHAPRHSTHRISSPPSPPLLPRSSMPSARGLPSGSAPLLPDCDSFYRRLAMARLHPRYMRLSPAMCSPRCQRRRRQRRRRRSSIKSNIFQAFAVLLFESSKYFFIFSRPQLGGRALANLWIRPADERGPEPHAALNPRDRTKSRLSSLSSVNASGRSLSR